MYLIEPWKKGIEQNKFCEKARRQKTENDHLLCPI